MVVKLHKATRPEDIPVNHTKTCAHSIISTRTEEVTKTKRALIRAVNKQMQLALKIDGLQAAYEKATSRGSRLLPRFGLRE